MNYDLGFRTLYCVLHDEVVLYSATQFTIVYRRVAMLSYINPKTQL